MRPSMERIKNAGRLFSDYVHTIWKKDRIFEFLNGQVNRSILLLTSSLPVSLGDVSVERIGHVRDVVRLFPATNKVHCHTCPLERCQYSLGDRRHFVEFEQGRVHVHERHLNKSRKRRMRKKKKKGVIARVRF